MLDNFHPVSYFAVDKLIILHNTISAHIQCLYFCGLKCKTFLAIMQQTPKNSFQTTMEETLHIILDSKIFGKSSNKNLSEYSHFIPV